MNSGWYKSPIGILKIVAEDEFIVEINFVDNIFEENMNDTILKCKKQLEEYFAGNRQCFNIKIKYNIGTEFQKLVWKELENIPYGKVVSYKYIAEKINNAKAVRAVGGANNKNPISIIVPCHRVVGSNGKLVGYAGGIDKKEFLLKLETMK